jgi:hypothetical protein
LCIARFQVLEKVNKNNSFLMLNIVVDILSKYDEVFHEITTVVIIK